MRRTASSSDNPNIISNPGDFGFAYAVEYAAFWRWNICSRKLNIKNLIHAADNRNQIRGNLSS
ncbi:MAG: hypothetical protein SCH70_10425 [Candidatus Methanoperedens sp.]|nr:hypothetical protein [Candidatus Methanoperedens sp.]